MVRLEKGSEAPDFCLPDQDQNMVCLRDLRGKKVLLFFYPKAMTPGCTRQVCNVRDAENDLRTHGVLVLGISPDPVEAQKKFHQRHSVNYPLLSDRDHLVSESYGVWGSKKMYGKTFQGITRSAFLIDENGKIIDAWYKISPDNTVKKVKEVI